MSRISENGGKEGGVGSMYVFIESVCMYMEGDLQEASWLLRKIGNGNGPQQRHKLSVHTTIDFYSTSHYPIVALASYPSKIPPAP